MLQIGGGGGQLRQEHHHHCFPSALPAQPSHVFSSSHSSASHLCCNSSAMCQHGVQVRAATAAAITLLLLSLFSIFFLPFPIFPYSIFCTPNFLAYSFIPFPSAFQTDRALKCKFMCIVHPFPFSFSVHVSRVEWSVVAIGFSNWQSPASQFWCHLDLSLSSVIESVSAWCV